MSEGFGRRAAVVVLAALALSLVLVVATASGPDAVSGRLGGDYVAFHAAGELVLDEPGLDPDRLYDPQRQFDAQEPLLPADAEGNLYFAYPAFFVAPFAALAALDFRLSYLLDVLLMTTALVVAFALLRPCSRVVRDHWIETLAVAISFFPLFRGITGGQNTALSLLLFAVVWRSLHDGREVPAGVAAGLLLFKPPLALPLIGLLLLGRHFRAFGAAAATAVGLYLVGVLLTGPSWPGVWLDAVDYLDRVDTPFNVDNFVSAPGAAEAIFGIDSSPAGVLGFGIAIAAALTVSWAWFRDFGGVGPRVALAAVAGLVVSPHALYYDAGLLVLAGIVLVDRGAVDRRIVAGAWAFGLTHPLLADALGVSPLVLLVLGTFVVVAHQALVREPQPRHDVAAWAG